jgi:phosphoglucomutase
MVYNTVVTSQFGAKIAESFGMKVKSTLTGFKFIGEQAKLIENTEYEFMFGYEESYGYVVKDFVRDKDSIQALLLASEIANIGKQTGLTLVDYLNYLYSEYGYYKEDLVNIVLEGASGASKIQEIMREFRNNAPSKVIGLDVVSVEDFQLSEKTEAGIVTALDYPKSNVLKYTLSDGSWYVLRPSGTEPKLKIYIGVLGENLEASVDKNKAIKEEVKALVDKI